MTDEPLAGRAAPADQLCWIRKGTTARANSMQGGGTDAPLIRAGPGFEIWQPRAPLDLRPQQSRARDPRNAFDRPRTGHSKGQDRCMVGLTRGAASWADSDSGQRPRGRRAFMGVGSALAATGQNRSSAVAHAAQLVEPSTVRTPRRCIRASGAVASPRPRSRWRRGAGHHHVPEDKTATNASGRADRHRGPQRLCVPSWHPFFMSVRTLDP